MEDPSRLGERLARIAREQPDRLSERLAPLPIRRQAELALSMDPADRLELLLHAPQPMRLVRALPDVELYLTVREVGPTDALPLLALASPRQTLYLIDLEAWRGDRFDGPRAGAWVALLLDAGEPALRGFLRRADDSLLALLFRRWLRVSPIELDDTPAVHGPGESETGDERGFVTPEGYHRFSPVIEEHGPAAQQLMRVFFADQRERYQQVLWLSHSELPSQLEEDALRWRQSRLEELGYLPWDEAIRIYDMPTGAGSRVDIDMPGEDVLPAPRSPLRRIDDPPIVLAALERLPDQRREQALAELAALANRVMVADSADPGDPRLHRIAWEKVVGLISIALERRDADGPERAGPVLDDVPLLELFREGHHPIAELAGRAQRMTSSGWASAVSDGLRLLDSPLQERIRALLEPRPLYVELRGGRQAAAERDFRTAAEVEETELAVRLAETIGTLFVERLATDPALLSSPAPPSFSTLLLTALAWHATTGQVRLEPLPEETVAAFLRGVASRRTAAADAPARAWASLLETLRERGRVDPPEASLLDGFGRACLEQLAAECSSLDPGAPVDPRFVASLLVAGPGR